VCAGGSCVERCADGVQNGDEGGVDCGGSELGCPACQRCTVDNSIDLGSVGSVTRVTADACARITRFASYAPLYVESFDAGPYPVPLSWSQECTAQSGSGVFESAYQRLPLSGISLDCPIVFEFAGSGAALQVRWY
jgi:hypothetical protein